MQRRRIIPDLDKLNPDVIFLEAVDDTYAGYDQYLFSTYGQYHPKVEIAAIQRYSVNNTFHYVPVCEGGLGEAFREKNRIVCQHREMQERLDHFNSLAATQGFPFLNSPACIRLQEEMRRVESRILNNPEMDKIIKADIEAYEAPMIRNIESYCQHHSFRSAIFLCGAAHRKALMEKMENSEAAKQGRLTWTVFEGAAALE